MTMTTRTYYRCPSGHVGIETLRENDQPYSAEWSQTSWDGVDEDTDSNTGKIVYRCSRCGELMVVDPSARPKV